MTGVPTLSIILPSIGRPSLATAIQSIKPQLAQGDEVVVIGDGPSDDGKRIVLEAGDPFTYLQTAERMWDWGGTPRNIGIGMARGHYLGFMDDDDIYLPGALDSIRRAAIEKPGVPLVFRMRHAGRIIWDDPVLRTSNVSSQMLAVPNIPGKVGRWTSRYAGDYDFIVQTVGLHGGAILFREDVIAELTEARKGVP